MDVAVKSERTAERFASDNFNIGHVVAYVRLSKRPRFERDATRH